jgi:hypothetical protein
MQDIAWDKDGHELMMENPGGDRALVTIEDVEEYRQKKAAQEEGMRNAGVKTPKVAPVSCTGRLLLLLDLQIVPSIGPSSKVHTFSTTTTVRARATAPVPRVAPLLSMAHPRAPSLSALHHWVPRMEPFPIRRLSS